MRSIEVDDEVFALLQKGATPLVDTPNSAIRKLLGLRVNGARARTGGTTVELDGLLEEALAERRNKAPKADLRQLVQAGLLHAGDRLHLVDYQGNRVGQFEAVVSGGMLEFKGQHYSMSSLAQELLKKVGFKSDSVRGPAHWVTSKGASVKELWQQLLDRRARK
jgi:hypothetical protein